MSVEILNPVKEIAVAGATWQVKEMNWRDGMQFLGMISKHASEVVSGEGGKVTVDFAKLPALVASMEELANFLLTRSTGRELAEVNALRFSDSLALIDAAIELNLSQELLERGKQIAGRVGAAFGVNVSKVSPLISATP